MKEEPIKRRRSRSQPGGGKRKNRDARRAQRRSDAEARQATYDALTLEEKIAKARRGSKEYRKLVAVRGAA